MSEEWIKALRFAALPGAARVQFKARKLIEDGTPTLNYHLQSETHAGDVIGDDRDYDLLKAAMGPLEKLYEASGHTELILELDLKNSTLRQIAAR